MSESTTSLWLPSDAIEAARFAPILRDILDEWARHWFIHRQASAVATGREDLPDPSMKWRGVDTVAAVQLPRNAQVTIASAMLGTQIPATSVQPNDLIVIEDLATSCVDDLLQRVSDPAGHKSSPREIAPPGVKCGDCSWWHISLGPKRAFKLAISESFQMALIKRRLPAPDQPKLRPIAHGLAGQEVGVSVKLGQCSISVTELQGLQAGDVVVLNCRSDEPQELLLGGSISPFRGTLETAGDITSIRISGLKDHDHV